MIRLLVSVRSASEARAALAGGADLIDVKEPRRGPLGASDPMVWRQVAAVLREANRGASLSVALGELEAPRGFRCLSEPLFRAGQAPALLHRELENRGGAALACEGDRRSGALPQTGAPPLTGAPPQTGAYACTAFPSETAFAKLGLSGWRDRPWQSTWHAALAELPPHVQRVAVVYADAEAAGAPDPWQVLASARDAGCRALLIDTFTKGRGDVFSFASRRALRELLAAGNDAGLLTVLAGALAYESLPAAMELRPHVIAVRSAACAAGRQSDVCEQRVRRLAQRLKGDHAAP